MYCLNAIGFVQSLLKVLSGYPSAENSGIQRRPLVAQRFGRITVRITHQIPGQRLLSGGLCFWSSVPVGNLQGLKVPQNAIRVDIRVIFWIFIEASKANNELHRLWMSIHGISRLNAP